MTTSKRVLLALGALLLVVAGIALVLAGFAFTVVWPGLSWAIGASLALVCFLAAAQMGRRAIPSNVRRPSRPTGETNGR